MRLITGACCRLLARKQALQRQIDTLRAAVENERKVQQQYEGAVHTYMEDRGHRTQELKDRAEQAGVSSLRVRAFRALSLCTVHPCCVQAQYCSNPQYTWRHA